MSENKNRKEIRKPYLAPRRSRPTPAQPAQRGTGVFFPVPRLQAARWNATELAGHATSPPRDSRPPRGLYSRPKDVSQPPHPFPSLQRDSFLLLRRFLPP